MTAVSEGPRGRFLDALLDRHLKDLKFGEVTRALRALSSGYVQKRDTGGLGGALDGRGKRAAFALYYGTVHFLVTELLVRKLGLDLGGKRPRLLDLGCGTGVCGAAWALGSARETIIVGADRSSFALHEARWTYQFLRLRGETRHSISEALDEFKNPDAIVVGWTLNELDDERRAALRTWLLPWVRKGGRLLVIEPVSQRVIPWWSDWVAAFPKETCLDFEERLSLPLPPKVALLARSAGLKSGASVVRVLASNAPIQRGDTG